jgi:hypothetical protein
MFEGYSMEGVHAIDGDSTAFAFRSENVLAAPLITSNVDKEVAQVGEQLRQILHEVSANTDVRAYVNYAYGDETLKQWYGNEAWRQSRLQGLKTKYDPEGRLSLYAPIA